MNIMLQELVERTSISRQGEVAFRCEQAWLSELQWCVTVTELHTVNICSRFSSRMSCFRSCLLFVLASETCKVDCPAPCKVQHSPELSVNTYVSRVLNMICVYDHMYTLLFNLVCVIVGFGVLS